MSNYKDSKNYNINAISDEVNKGNVFFYEFQKEYPTVYNFLKECNFNLNDMEDLEKNYKNHNVTEFYNLFNKLMYIDRGYGLTETDSDGVLHLKGFIDTGLFRIILDTIKQNAYCSDQTVTKPESLKESIFLSFKEQIRQSVLDSKEKLKKMYHFNYFEVSQDVIEKINTLAQEQNYELLTALKMSNHPYDSNIYIAICKTNEQSKIQEYVCWYYNGRALTNGYYSRSFKSVMNKATDRIHETDFMNYLNIENEQEELEME